MSRTLERVRPLLGRLSILICLAAQSAPAQPEPLLDLTDDPILLTTLRHIDQGLRSADPVRSRQLLKQIARETNLSQAVVETHLLERLQTLETLRQEGGQNWERLVEMGDRLSRRQLSRLMDHLGRALRKIVTTSDDYLLDTSLRWAARGARVPPEEAMHFISRLVASQLTNDPLAPDAEPVGVVVNGWTEKYEFKLEPLLIYLGTDDENDAREAVRDIQRFIIPGVVRGLPIVPGVAWAFRQRDLTALVDPAFDIRVRVRTLRFSGLTTDLQPCIDVGITIIDTETTHAVQELDVDHCSVAISEKRLAPFFNEVAEVIVDRLAPFFVRYR